MNKSRFIAAPNWRECTDNRVIDLERVRTFRIPVNEKDEVSCIEFQFEGEDIMWDVHYWRFETNEEAEHCYSELVNRFALEIPSEEDQKDFLKEFDKKEVDNG